MKDVEKTNVERDNSRKRMRRRSRKMSIYGFIVAAFVIAGGLAISYTFLFNISEIRVSGESDVYSAEEIVAASGINEGDNLLRMNTKKSEKLILEKLLYVETAVVDRDFPTSVEIKVTRCVPAYNVSYDDGTLLVSRKGKILADNGFVTDGLPIVYGYEPLEKTPGKVITSHNKHKAQALLEFLENSEGSKIASVDMTDEFSVLVNYKDGMVFKMGSWEDVTYKLSLAESVMNDDTVKGKKGYLTMIGTNQCSFRTSDDIVEKPGITAPTTQPVTDAEGNTVPSGQISVESDPEQASIFDQYNENATAQSDESAGEDSNDSSDDGVIYDDGGSGGDDGNYDTGYVEGGYYDDNGYYVYGGDDYGYYDEDGYYHLY